MAFKKQHNKRTYADYAAGNSVKSSCLYVITAFIVITKTLKGAIVDFFFISYLYKEPRRYLENNKKIIVYPMTTAQVP